MANQKARNLRKRPTDAEKKLWRQLRNQQVEGRRFRRQHPIGPYIVDFVCLDKKLVIEVDGGQHGSPEGLQSDAVRTDWLEDSGYDVLRFWNNEVLQNIEGVITAIRQKILET